MINGGFGLVLDGTDQAEERASAMLNWDVSNGLARRSWARNPGAIYAARKAMEAQPGMKILLPEIAEDDIVEGAFS